MRSSPAPDIDFLLLLLLRVPGERAHGAANRCQMSQTLKLLPQVLLLAYCGYNKIIDLFVVKLSVLLVQFARNDRLFV